MSYRLLISDEAAFDIEATFQWYELQKPSLGNEFKEMLDQAFQLLKNDPHIFQERYKTVRVLFLKKFPYGIHYLISGKEIQIVAVFHCARNPKSWKLRLRKH
jgi:toxin ParE1/3/4